MTVASMVVVFENPILFKADVDLQASGYEVISTYSGEFSRMKRYYHPTSEDIMQLRESINEIQQPQVSENDSIFEEVSYA